MINEPGWIVSSFPNKCRTLDNNPTTIMKGIGEHFTIKDDKYGEPTTYLGANIERTQLDDGSWAWSMTSEHYVKNLIETVSPLLTHLN